MPSESTEQRRLTAIMFTDMVGYSALSQRDETLALRLLEEHRVILRGLFPKRQGNEIKTTGDGFLVEFASALAAVQCAVEIQQALAARNRKEPPGLQVRIRIGIHLGDVVERDGDMHGDGVNIAARIEPLAEAGGICISNAVYDQVHNKVEHRLVRLNWPELKNIKASVQVYRVEFDGTDAVLKKAPSTRLRVAIGVSAAAILTAAFLLLPKIAQPKPVNAATNRAPAQVIARTIAEKSIAVLAFANLSDDPNNEYFSDGISEELLNVLAKVPGLKVSARTSAFYFKGKSAPIDEIARQLGVAYVVEGSVRKSGNRVRITAQLIKAADGFHVWSDNFDRELKDVFAVQDEIAGLVAGNLQLSLGLGAAPRAAANMDAMQLYFQWRQLWNLRSDEALNQMEGLIKRALEIDDHFAAGEAGLAEVLVTRAFTKCVPAQYLERELAEAEAHGNRAIQLDPMSAEAFEALGTAAMMRGRLSESEAAFKKSIAANPNHAAGWNKYGWLLGREGRIGEALEMYRRAHDIDPLVWSIQDGVSMGELHVGNYRGAEESFQKEESFAVVAPPSVANHSIAFFFLSQNAEAKAKARQLTTSAASPNWPQGLQSWCRALAAWTLAETGERDEAAGVVQEIRSGPASQRCAAGLALFALGKKEQAYEIMDDFPQQLVPYLWLMAQRHPELAEDRRFVEFLQKIGATQGFKTARENLLKLKSQTRG